MSHNNNNNNSSSRFNSPPTLIRNARLYTPKRNIFCSPSLPKSPSIQQQQQKIFESTVTCHFPSSSSPLTTTTLETRLAASYSIQLVSPTPQNDNINNENTNNHHAQETPCNSNNGDASLTSNLLESFQYESSETQNILLWNNATTGSTITSSSHSSKKTITSSSSFSSIQTNLMKEQNPSFDYYTQWKKKNQKGNLQQPQQRDYVQSWLDLEEMNHRHSLQRNFDPDEDQQQNLLNEFTYDQMLKDWETETDLKNNYVKQLESELWVYRLSVKEFI